MRYILTYAVYPSGFMRHIGNLNYFLGIGDKVKLTSCDKDGYCEHCAVNLIKGRHYHMHDCLRQFEIVELIDDAGIVTAWLEKV